MRRMLVASLMATSALLGGSTPGLTADKAFPYEQELMLDARPMKGSKRVPMMEIKRQGETAIELWCNTVRAQLVVVEDTITILTGAKTEQQCDPERKRADEELVAALEQVTNWRLDGDVLTLRGSKTLRFRTSTH
jgi:heat shock protein HslJ